MGSRAPRTRSRTGCLTCRRRKVKCDEKSYPRCSNCEHRALECVWSPSKRAIYETLRDVKYVGGREGDDESGKRLLGDAERIIAKHRRDESTVAAGRRECGLGSEKTAFSNGLPLEGRTAKALPSSEEHTPKAPGIFQKFAVVTHPPSQPKLGAIWADETKSSILTRIALQEECVEDEVQGA